MQAEPAPKRRWQGVWGDDDGDRERLRHPIPRAGERRTYRKERITSPAKRKPMAIDALTAFIEERTSAA
jgi:hypothetical protein